MTLLWTKPRVWETRDPITADKLNEISNQLTYLFAPSRAIKTVNNTGSNKTISSTTAVVLDTAVYLLNLELTGLRDVRIVLTGVLNNTTLAAANRLDVLIDGSMYLSSLTNTPLANGIWIQNQYVANLNMTVAIDLIIPAGVLAAGIHTFEPLAWVSAGAMVWIEATAYSQFMVTE